MQSKGFVVIFLFLLPSAGSAALHSVTICDGSFRMDDTIDTTYAGMEDNHLRAGSSSNKNFGGASNISVGNGSYRTLLRFNLSPLYGEHISGDATLTLTSSGTGGDYTVQTLNLYLMEEANSSWEEGTGSPKGSTLDNVSCWNYLSYSNTIWDGNTEGVAGNIGVTPSLTLIDSVTLPANITTTSFTITGNIVQNWIDNDGIALNAGLLLMAEKDGVLVGDDSWYATYWSSEGPTSKRPTLEFAVAPEPATIALLLPGGLAMLRQRRR